MAGSSVGSVHDQQWNSSSEIKVPSGHLLGGNIEPLFSKIEPKEIEKRKTNLGKRSE
jgi:hypothetical protein